MDNAADGVMSYTEAIHQGLVAVFCSQKPQSDGQPQSRVHCLPVEGILLGDYGPSKWNISWNIAGSTWTKFVKAATAV